MCFLLNKYGKLSPKALKSALTDFYSIDILPAAKQRFLYDVNLMGFTEKLPHVPKRRDTATASRLSNEADDMLALMQFVDERGSLSSLPRYVSSGPDNMPSIRLFEGDMQFLLSRLDKLEDNLVRFGSALAAINAQLQNRPTPHASNGGKVLSTTQSQALSQPMTTKTSATASLTTAHLGISTRNSLISEDTNNQVKATASWAERVASSPNVQQSSRAQEYSSQSESNDDLSQFQEVRSRKKRIRLRSNEPATEIPAQFHTQKGKPLIVGKMPSNSNSNAQGITAAQQKIQFTKKAVFYIGNVNKDVTVDQMHAFVTGLSVEILSLFATRPRQPRRYISDSSKTVDTAAFRLCINKDHCSRLLDDTQWPAYIVVSEWFFKPAVLSTPTIQNNHTSEQVIVVPDNNVASVDNSNMDEIDCMNNTICGEDDNTIIMCDHSQDPHGSSPIIEDGER